MVKIHGRKIVGWTWPWLELFNFRVFCIHKSLYNYNFYNIYVVDKIFEVPVRVSRGLRKNDLDPHDLEKKNTHTQTVAMCPMRYLLIIFSAIIALFAIFNTATEENSAQVQSMPQCGCPV